MYKPATNRKMNTFQCVGSVTMMQTEFQLTISRPGSLINPYFIHSQWPCPALAMTVGTGGSIWHFFWGTF